MPRCQLPESSRKSDSSFSSWNTSAASIPRFFSSQDFMYSIAVLPFSTSYSSGAFTSEKHNVKYCALGECNKSHQTYARGELRTSRSSLGSDVRLYTVALLPPRTCFTRSDLLCSASRPQLSIRGIYIFKISRIIWSMEVPPPNFSQFSRNYSSSLAQLEVQIVFQEFLVPCVSIELLLLLSLFQ